MTEEGFLRLQEQVLHRISTEVDSHLTYHNVRHTVDVINSVETIAASEKITDPSQLMLLKLAALFHDTGFIHSYRGHEEKSCEIMEAALSGNGLGPVEIRQIRAIIMATKMPQSPRSLNEQIICDADLDYLGREDFDEINSDLKQEWLTVGMLEHAEDWNRIQLEFLENHRYFTSASNERRQPGKLKQIEILRTKISESKPEHE